MATGRNDPCPCGSGRKYKKCCGVNAVTSSSTAPNAGLALAPLTQAVKFHRLGLLAQAEVACRQALQQNPHQPQALDLMGLILSQQGNLPSATHFFTQAIRQEKHHPEFHNHLGIALHQAMQYVEAEGCFREALQLQPNYAETHNNLGNTLKELNRLTEAEACFRHAIKLRPRYTDAHFNLGLLLDERGDLKRAEACYRMVLDHNPLDPGAWCKLARILEKQDRNLETYDCYRKMEGLLLRPEIKPLDRISLCRALGKAYDQAGNHDAAFAKFTQASQLQQREHRARGVYFDPAAFAEFVEGMIEAFPGMLACGSAGSDSELPVFIVGMPRSGTTLVEQILASHSQVHGAGELREISRMFASLPPDANGMRYPRNIATLEPEVISRMAQRYLQFIATLAPGAVRILDKMPDNILHLGLIALLFPKARVIHCRRDPRDICLSCYFQDFEGAPAFTSDLTHCALRYLETERLMGHWRRVLPLQILEVHYEQLVDNVEDLSRQLIRFLGFEWEDTCLEFFRTDRPVKTASRDQVRRPVYTSSVGRWRHYEKHIQPLLEVLGRNVYSQP